MSEHMFIDKAWWAFAKRVETAARKVWPGAVVAPWTEALYGSGFHVLNGPQAAGRHPTYILLTAFEKSSVSPSRRDLAYVTPDDKGLARIVERLKANIRVEPGVADGAYDNRLHGYAKGAKGARRGHSAGTTADERKTYLANVRRLIGYMHNVSDSLANADEYAASKARSAPGAAALTSIRAHAINAMQRAGALEAIFAVLREYKLPEEERKILEAVASDLQRLSLRQPRKTVDPVAYRKKIVDVLATYNEALAISKRMLESGAGSGGGDAVCEKNECHVGGCFRVVNTGGFDAKTMKLATDLVAKAADLVNAAGFPQVCYGDAYVTQRISRSNVLAFYVGDDDRMYVRAKPAKGEGALAVETIVHELGHRLHQKFLSKKKAGWLSDERDAERVMLTIYHDWIRRYERSPVNAETFDPKEGEVFEHGKNRVKITRVGEPGPYQHVSYRHVDAHGEIVPKYGESTMLKTKLALALGQGARADNPFPSPYSRSSHEEMFAEIFRAVVIGTATPEQREALSEILRAGGLKYAPRVASGRAASGKGSKASGMAAGRASKGRKS